MSLYSAQCAKQFFVILQWRLVDSVGKVDSLLCLPDRQVEILGGGDKWQCKEIQIKDIFNPMRDNYWSKFIQSIQFSIDLKIMLVRKFLGTRTLMLIGLERQASKLVFFAPCWQLELWNDFKLLMFYCISFSLCVLLSWSLHVRPRWDYVQVN